MSKLYIITGPSMSGKTRIANRKASLVFEMDDICHTETALRLLIEEWMSSKKNIAVTYNETGKFLHVVIDQAKKHGYEVLNIKARQKK